MLDIIRDYLEIPELADKVDAQEFGKSVVPFMNARPYVAISANSGIFEHALSPMVPEARDFNRNRAGAGELVGRLLGTVDVNPIIAAYLRNLVEWRNLIAHGKNIADISEDDGLNCARYMLHFLIWKYTCWAKGNPQDLPQSYHDPRLKGGGGEPPPFIRNLPSRGDRFIGREDLRIQLKNMVTDRQTRLVTLRGTGGAGKTRLAIEVGWDLSNLDVEGVYFVDLAEVSDPELILQTIARAMGVHDNAGATEDGLVSNLKHKRDLIILDNCEQFTAKVRHLVSRLIRDTTQVKLLVTSRELLRVSGENVFEVKPLTLPKVNGTVDLAKARLSEAVCLFETRARAYDPEFTVDEKNVRPVADICIRLDGVPLALELAAARVRSLSVENIAERLGSRFKLFRGESRQSSLKGLIDWSYELLTEPEKQLLLRMTIFPGSFTLNALEEVAGDLEPTNCAQTLPLDKQRIERFEVLDLLQSVHDKSLIIRDTEVGEYRYRLLETIREYLKERLTEFPLAEAAPFEDRFRRRLASYCSDLADKFGPQVNSGKVKQASALLNAEMPNFRAVLDWAEETRETKLEFHLKWRLFSFWIAQGYLLEGRARIEKLLHRPEGFDEQMDKVRALNMTGSLCMDLADFDGALACYLEAIELLRAMDKPVPLGVVLRNYGALKRDMGEYEGADTALRESIEIFQSLPESPRWDYANALYTLGDVLLRTGCLEEARSLLNEALALQRQEGDDRAASLYILSLARLAYLEGHMDSAVHRADEAIETLRELNDNHGLTEAHLIRAELSLLARDYDGAEAAFKTALGLANEVGSKKFQATARIGIAAIALALNEPQRTRIAHEQLGQAVKLAAKLDESTKLFAVLYVHTWAVNSGAEKTAAKLLERIKTLGKIVKLTTFELEIYNRWLESVGGSLTSQALPVRQTNLDELFELASAALEET
jgi:predicted ATPase